MFKTKITEMFGIKYPIICGGMMNLCVPKLCAAVSNAGGMGNITAAIWRDETSFRAAIKETRRLTDKPFTVNLTILPSVRVSASLHPMYVRVCAEEQVAALEISGAPLDRAVGGEAVETLKKAGVRLFHKVGSVRHALHAEKVGYDGIYAAGVEEGGHPLNDDVTTILLTPLISEAVKIPVVAAGGIADGRSLAAALTLGADGVMMASRFIATQECEVHDNIKQELIRRQENDTTLFGKSIGLQGRALKNEVIDKYLEIEARGGGLDELMPLMAGAQIEQVWKTGDVSAAPIMVGQSIGLIRDIPTCQELLDRMATEAVETLKGVGRKILGDLSANR